MFPSTTPTVIFSFCCMYVWHYQQKIYISWQINSSLNINNNNLYLLGKNTPCILHKTLTAKPRNRPEVFGENVKNIYGYNHKFVRVGFRVRVRVRVSARWEFYFYLSIGRNRQISTKWSKRNSPKTAKKWSCYVSWQLNSLVIYPVTHPTHNIEPCILTNIFMLHLRAAAKRGPKCSLLRGISGLPFTRFHTNTSNQWVSSKFRFSLQIRAIGPGFNIPYGVIFIVDTENSLVCLCYHSQCQGI